MSKLVRNTVVIAVLAAAAIVGTTVQAEEVVTRKTNVSFGDLQLDREADARAFIKRVDRAATTVCGGRPVYQPAFVRAVQRFSQCRETAVLSALQQVDHPMVWATYRKATQPSEQPALASR